MPRHPSPIPPSEADRFAETLDCVVELAESGRLSEGCRTLIRGVEHARSLVEAGYDWAPKLEARYGGALTSYLARCLPQYGVRTAMGPDGLRKELQ